MDRVMQKQHKKNLIRLTLKAIKKHKIKSIVDITKHIPCSISTFYNLNLHRLDIIKNALSNNKKLKSKSKIIRNIIGHKDEPYYKTEKEMLEDKIYNYASLSELEKGIYTKLKNNEHRKSNF
jgi:hypothetical protein